MKDLQIFKTKEEFYQEYPSGEVPSNKVTYIVDEEQTQFSTNNIDGTIQQIVGVKASSGGSAKIPVTYNPSGYTKSSNYGTITFYFQDGTVIGYIVANNSLTNTNVATMCSKFDLTLADITMIQMDKYYFNPTDVSGYTSLKAVIYGDNIYNNGNYSVWSGCTSIEYAAYGRTTTYLGEYNFAKCPNINTIVFANPNLVIDDEDEEDENDLEYSDYAFSQAGKNSGVLDIYSKVTNPWDLDMYTIFSLNVIENVHLNLHVPTGYTDKYFATYKSNWLNYFKSYTIIEDYNY